MVHELAYLQDQHVDVSPHQKHQLQLYELLRHHVFQVYLYHIQIFYKVLQLVDHLLVKECKNQFLKNLNLMVYLSLIHI